MAIEFKCDHCGKLVKAPDEAGGKHGKCPGCHQSVYVPTPRDQIEPLEIAPIDESEEREREQLLKESVELQRKLIKEREIPASAGGAPTPSGGTMPTPKLDMETLIIEYALAMAEGNLEQAEQYAADIHSDMDAANETMQRLTSDEMPPEQLAKIPRPVLIGFFRQLQVKK